MNRLAQQVHDTFSGFYLERWNVANQKIIELQEAFDSSGSLILSWPSWSKLVIKISIEDSLPVLSRSPLTLQQISEWGSQLKLTPQQISEWVQLTQQQISEPKTAQKQQPDENGDSLAKATQELIESGFIMATGLAVEQASSEPKDFNLEDLLLYVKQMYEKRKHEIQKRLNTIKPKKTYFSFDKEPKEEVKLQELLHDIDRIQAAVDTAEKIIDQIDKYLEGVNAVYREFLPYHPDKSEEGIFLLACNVSGLEFHIDTAGNPVLTFPRRFQKVSSKKTM